VSDYERLVELAAKGLAERDNHLMPRSVTTPKEFYEGMARAALDAADIPLLLERVARAERSVEATQEAARQADSSTERARHRATTDNSDGLPASLTPQAERLMPLPSPRGAKPKKRKKG
jgi:hypothetical protein